MSNLETPVRKVEEDVWALAAHMCAYGGIYFAQVLGSSSEHVRITVWPSLVNWEG